MAAGEPIIALVAGEASGDQLGAGLIRSLRRRLPGARFVGIGGDQMQAADFEAWRHSGELAVMGLFEVVSHLPRLLGIRRELTRRLLELRPDVFIGIDAPDFNLGLEGRLRKAGLKTVHYVSPTVWAWRQRRVRKIARSADLVLCLFPFEPDFYRDFDVAASYVGHPLADQISPDGDAPAARAELGLDPAARTVALLPGSRVSEVTRLAAPMIEAARILREQDPHLQLVCAAAGERVAEEFRQVMQGLAFEQVHVVQGRPRRVIAAADAVICASGTATLETMLVNRPLVMAYRLSPATYHLAKQLRLVRLRLFSLPNILAGEPLIPEFMQNEANGENLAAATRKWLDDPAACKALSARFTALHEQLQRDASERAADAVCQLLSGAGS